MIEQVPRDTILDLRWSVLGPHLPRHAAIFAEESDANVFHLAYRLGDVVISCLTFLPEPIDGSPAWRLRGMATMAEHRGKGIGGQLLEAGIAMVVERGGILAWCNGRSAARSFYERHSFTVRGPEFQRASVPHFVFVRKLAIAPQRR